MAAGGSGRGRSSQSPPSPHVGQRLVQVLRVYPTGSAASELVYNTWRSPRIMRFGKHRAVTPWFALCGLPAGDGYNDLATKVHACTEFDEFFSRCPAIDFLDYIDDAALSSVARDEEIAVKFLFMP
eukprot:2312979-Pyramimonas_sp.AAC.1